MYEVRAFDPNTDLEALQEIYLRSREHAFPWLDADKFATGDFEQDSLGESILVIGNEQPLGFSSVWQKTLFLHHLYLHPNAMQRGLGAALLNATLDAFGRPMRLKCLKRNTPAIAFYQSQGWQVTGAGDGVNGPFYDMQIG